MFRPRRSIILFQSLSQGMRGYPDNGIHLRIKVFRASQYLHSNAVFLDFVDGSVKVPLTNENQKSNKIVGSAEHP
jgi:hypothetical protein